MERFICLFKQKTAYEMRISDWSADVCSSDLRDGPDIGCCRDVKISNCTVNAHKDDAIVLKSSYALERKVMCEDVTIIGCKTSGYALGTMLDGTYELSDYRAPDEIGRASCRERVCQYV